MNNSEHLRLLDADAPFSDEERAEAALTLAVFSQNLEPVDPAFEQKLQRDAVAFFATQGKRRQPKSNAATTTSGAEVIVVGESANENARTPQRTRWPAWAFAAAAMAMAVFAWRASALSRGSEYATASAAYAVGEIRLKPENVVQFEGFSKLPSGQQYVIWSQSSDGKRSRIGEFSESCTRTLTPISGEQRIGVTAQSVGSDGSSSIPVAFLASAAREPTNAP
jgi:hypothetical protein